MKSTQRSDPARTTLNPTEQEEQIRLRAYTLYEERGRADGHEREDWFQAEAEILGTQRKATAA